ncbi:MAG: DsbA family oxidoreductase [Pseudomonadota bacterium]
MISLEIISDPICPWCYVGKSKLDRALAQIGRNPFDIEWRIFQLNPDMPAEGMDRKQYLETKFGGPEGAARVYGAIGEAAKAAGLELKLAEIPRTPNTMDAHRLIRWASASGDQQAVVDDLFRRYFEESEDISDPDVLCDVAEQAGMERDVVARLLEGEADREALQEEDRAAREMGVTGVPTFVISRRYVLQGAQETETWLKVISEIWEQLDNPTEAEAEVKP